MSNAAFAPTGKPGKTLADHLAIGVGPVLIMVLVGSLVFFLALLLYRDGYPMHLYWTLLWFVLGSVLVSRIAIEAGSTRSALYGLALGAATALWLIRYVDPPFGGLALLGVTWWCTRKLVINCTLIDEDDDSSGEGLLDAAGIGESTKTRHPNPEPRQPGRLLYANYATKAVREAALAAETMAGTTKRPTGNGGTPGSWVLYFSLGALPLFGLGDALMSHVEPLRRTIAFALVCAYILAALGLLLMTGFLSFRRYLRQRRLVMPARIAGAWIFSGTFLGVCVLLLCILLPRPHATYSLPALAGRLGTHSLRPAPWKLTYQGDRDKDNDPRSDESDGQGNNPAKDGKEPDSPGKQASGKPGGQAAGQAEDQLTTLNGLMTPKYDPVWLKRLVNSLFVIAAVLLLLRYRAKLWEGFTGLWRDLLALFSRPKAVNPPSPPQGPAKPVLSFERLRNPFNGQGHRLGTSELVRHTFQALEAWAHSRGVGRLANETPLEFALRIRDTAPEIGPETHDLACQYTRLAYSGREPDSDSLANLSLIWGYMTTHPASVVG